MNVDFTIIVCSFNNSKLLKNCVNSIKKFICPFPPMIVCENSDNPSQLKESILFLENQKISFIVNDGPNRRHATGVRMLIPLIKTKYGLLIDTDIEIRKAPSDLLSVMENDSNIAVAGYYGKHFPQYVERIHPWYMLFRADIANREQFYFNCEKTEEQTFKPIFSKNKTKKYDVGSRFCEELLSKGYKILAINGESKDHNRTPWYFHHEGLSWCNRRNDPLLDRRKKILRSIEERF